MKGTNTSGSSLNRKSKTFGKIEPYIWLLPSILLMAVFVLYPIVVVFKTSVSEVSRSGLIKGFAGLKNFQDVLSGPTFGMVLKNTAVWTIVVVGLSTLFGIILGLVLNNKFRGRKIARAVIVFPWATSLIIQASVWKFIINKDYGTLNVLLMRLGIIDKAINWTPSPEAYFAWECWVGIFVTVPFVTFCVLSGLQSIDESYYEAATVDGASYWQKLFHITIPLLKNSLTVSTVLNIIYVFNSFPIIWTITKGDPASRTDTLVTYLYKLAFYKSRSGQAAAVSVIGFLILLVCAGVYMILTLRGEED